MDGSAEQLTTAYHEAGHAVMAMICGRSVLKINIASKKMSFGTRLGVCEMGKGKSGGTKDWLEDEVMIQMAGMVGESLFTGTLDRAGAAQDMQLVKELIAKRAASDKQFKRLRRRMLEKTEYLLGQPQHSKAVEFIAKDLAERKKLSGRAVKHHFNMAMQT